MVAVRCDHPDASDGVFYCVPSMFRARAYDERRAFLLLDAKAVLKELATNNPHFFQHCDDKFYDGRPKAETVQAWLKATRFERPCDMGFWSYGEHRPLAMGHGYAGHVALVQELGLPYFPVAVDRREAGRIDWCFGRQMEKAPLVTERVGREVAADLFSDVDPLCVRPDFRGGRSQSPAPHEPTP